MTTFPFPHRLADFQKPPQKNHEDEPPKKTAMPWFLSSIGFFALAATSFTEYGPVEWGLGLAACIVSVIGGIRAMRSNNTTATMNAVKEAVPVAVKEAVDASKIPTKPEEFKEFAKLVAVYLDEIQQQREKAKEDAAKPKGM